MKKNQTQRRTARITYNPKCYDYTERCSELTPDAFRDISKREKDIIKFEKSRLRKKKMVNIGKNEEGGFEVNQEEVKRDV